MDGIERNGSEAGLVDPKIFLSALAAGLGQPTSVEEVAELFERAKLTPMVVALVGGMMPAQVDPEQWSSWLNGGPPPAAQWRLADPDAGRKPAARGAWQSMLKKRQAVQRKVERLAHELREAEDDLKVLRDDEATAGQRLRVVVLYQLLQEISAHTTGVFAMGPAWTLMRSVSGYIRADPSFEGTLSSGRPEELEQRKLVRPKESRVILDLLDRYSGDERLELNLHKAIYKVLMEHHAPVQKEIDEREHSGRRLSPEAKRPRRNEAAQQSSVRPGAPTYDSEDVLGGFEADEAKTVGDPPLDTPPAGT